MCRVSGISQDHLEGVSHLLGHLGMLKALIVVLSCSIVLVSQNISLSHLFCTFWFVSLTLKLPGLLHYITFKSNHISTTSTKIFLRLSRLLSTTQHTIHSIRNGAYCPSSDGPGPFGPGSTNRTRRPVHQPLPSGTTKAHERVDGPIEHHAHHSQDTSTSRNSLGSASR